MKNCLHIGLLALLLLTVAPSACASVGKGFEALQMKDYFKAKKIFSKGMKYNPEASSYGLAIIYSRNDNPFFNRDSAYRYIIIADTNWMHGKERKKEKWAVYSWTRMGIDSMKQVISDQFFRIAREAHSVSAYTEFMAAHSWSRHMDAALASRDSLAFFQAMADNSSAAYKDFLATYPTSVYAPIAEDNYYNSQFHEQTERGSLESYVRFIREHPNSPMLPEAYRAVYELVTKPNTLQAYELFVLGYDDNPHVEKAWGEYYQLFISEYSCERIERFLEKYPDAPNREAIEQEAAWCDFELLPNSRESFYQAEERLFGFMSKEGKQIIDCSFDYVGPFHEGLAIVIKDGKYGYIDKLGNYRIECQFDAANDFHNGRAVVEKDEKLGLIDRNNRLLLPFAYEDIGEMSQERVYVSKGEQYGYADLNGNLVIPEKFDEAYDFSNGFARVVKDDKYGLINRDGEFVIDPLYEELTPFTDSLMLCMLDGLKGLLTRNGTTVIAPKYEQIGDFSEGLALVAHGDTIEYINLAGEVVITKDFRTYPNFLLKGAFHEGAAIVMNKKGKYGRINPYGNIVTECQYDNLGLGAKFIPFEKKEYWGLMNTANKILISAEYESIDVVDNNFVVARLGDSLGVMDPNGNTVLPFQFEDIEYLKDGVFVVEEEGTYALFVGKERLTEAEFDSIGLFGEDFVHLVKGKEVVYYDLKQKKLIKSEEGE